MANLPPLPPGYQLEGAPTPDAAPAPALPPIPPGFQLETSPPTQPSGPDIGGMVGNVLGSIPLIGPVNRAEFALFNQMNNAAPPGPDERRGDLAPIIRNTQTGAMRFAAPQWALDAGDMAKRVFTAPGDVANGKLPLDIANHVLPPETIGRGLEFSALMGGAGSMAGNGMATPATKAIVDASGKNIPGLITRDLVRSGIAPQDVNASIKAMGPGAMLADLSPVLQGRAAKLATLPEAAQDTVAEALSARQAGAAQRVPAALNDIAGAEPVPSAISAGIEARQKLIGPYYDKAFADAKPVDTSSIVANINGNIAMMRGPAQKALSQLRPMFDVHQSIDGGVPRLSQDPRTLFEVRNAIDGMLSDETNPKVIGALTNVRQKVDAALGAAVPGIKKLDMFYQEQARQQEGFDLGRTALRGGEAPLHPDDLAAAMQKTTMQTTGPVAGGPYPSAYPTMIRNGMLSKMYEIIGNNVNDRLSLRKILVGDGKWNYQKISSAFGADKADRLLKLFQNEATMAQTENLALAGSKTARMASGGQGMEANPNQAGFLKSALNLDFGDAALGLGSKLTGGAFDARRAARNSVIADALMSSGGFKAVPGGSPLADVFAATSAGAETNAYIDWRKKQRLLGLN